MIKCRLPLRYCFCIWRARFVCSVGLKRRIEWVSKLWVTRCCNFSPVAVRRRTAVSTSSQLVSAAITVAMPTVSPSTSCSIHAMS